MNLNSKFETCDTAHDHRFFRAVVAIVAGGWFASAAGAAIIFGGPTYDSTTQTGYLSHRAVSAGDGVAVGWTSKYVSGIDKGFRGVRWDVSGAAPTELGSLGTNSSGFTNSFAATINTVGTAVGYASKYDADIYKGDRAVRWDASGTAATELGNLGTDSSGITYCHAGAINTAGTAVGSASKYVSGIYVGPRAVRWAASGTAATELGNLGTDFNGVTDSYASAINTAGTAVGFAGKYESGIGKGSRAVRWDGSGTAATELGNLGTDFNGVTDSYASAINTAGTAVGSAAKYDMFGDYKGRRAVRWDATGTAATELENLSGDYGVQNSYVYAINDAGTAVGEVEIWQAGVHLYNLAVRWDGSGTAATELGYFSVNTKAYAINAAGIAVGSAGTSLHNSLALAWSPEGGAEIFLNNLIDPGSGWVTLYEARSISDTNWVTGIGSFDPDGPGPLAPYDRMFLLNISSAVPEPAGLSLVGIGAAALLSRRRRWTSTGSQVRRWMEKQIMFTSRSASLRFGALVLAALVWAAGQFKGVRSL